MTKPVFVLGVGAPKAGTSWLHAQLHRQTYADFGFIKEYHIWDAKFNPLSTEFVANPFKGERSSNALRRLMQQDDHIYTQYFKSLLSDTIWLTGDISPGYSTLDSEVYKRIRDLLESAGFSLKIIYLMRDPVQRIWSSLRMIQRNQASEGHVIEDSDLIQRFIAHTQSPVQRERTCYDQIVPRLLGSFDPSQVYFDFYEQLFQSQSIEKIGNFIGAKLADVDVEQKVNESKSIALPAELQAQGRKIFSDVYDFCYQTFPETRELWDQDV